MRIKLWAGILGAVAVLVGCQPGTLDSGWDGDGVVALTSWMYDSHEMAAFPDGSVVVSRMLNDEVETGLTKLLPNGSVDSSWGVGGTFTQQMLPGGAESGPLQIGVLADGGLIVATSFNAFEAGLVKVTPQGTLDTSYGVGGRVVRGVFSTGDLMGPVAINPDGTVVELAAASQDGLTLRRYSAAGQLASTTVVPVPFSVSLPPGATNPLALPYPVHLVADGSSLVAAFDMGGAYTSSGGQQVLVDDDVAVVRLTSGNVVDPTWNGGAPVNLDPGVLAGADTADGGWSNHLADIEVQPGGGVVVAVHGYDPATVEDLSFLVRMGAGGTLDPGFDGNGVVQVRTPGGVPVEVLDVEAMGTADHVTLGGRVVSGAADEGVVLRLTGAGVADVRFGPAGDGQITLPGLNRVNDLEGSAGKVYASGPVDGADALTQVHVHRLFG